MLRLRAGLCAFGVALLAALPTPGRVAAPPRFECDSLVRTRPSDPLRYRQRGDRCEGVYGREVAAGSSSLLVVSLVEWLEPFADTASPPLHIEWAAPRGAPVSLRAYSLRPGLFYRMETARPITATHFDWPSDVRAPLRIGSADVGVKGATVMTLGGARREVLVPLRIGRRAAAPRMASHRLTLLPSVGLSEVFVTVAATDSTGAPTQYLKRDEKLGYGYYPAQRAIDVRLPVLGASGVYFVRVAATLERGGSATTSVLLLHPGPVGRAAP
ncbi:MAG TPA: hypothetical protein VFS59_17700 [Gemmatimonadaceae bacterium]|nr:hypothetical protein [Gemmatimonadaceae bacterium]